ncbi:unnamed protein product [Effrenium voratum]|nr:unnamed protein product [Effrenium voratum]CAJ1425676.1 unnamed protein product [Effrenium voratum]
MSKGFFALVLCAQTAVGQKFAAFDAAVSSSVYSSKSFAAELAVAESSGYWCSVGHHAPGDVVSWTGEFNSRRQISGVQLRWSYAPAEVKVLTSADGGNFEEAAAWRRIARAEPSFEETVMFARPVAAKAVMVLMRGPKPWGYFGLAHAAALSGPASFMLVSGAPSREEQCAVAGPKGLRAEACLGAMVAGEGKEIFSLSEDGQLKTQSGQCLGLRSGGLVFRTCAAGQGAWEVTADGQVKQGGVCLMLSGERVEAVDCGEAAALGSDKFFQVAVTAQDPAAVVAVQSMGSLLKASVERQRKLMARLQALLPRLASCKSSSLKGLSPRVEFSLAAAGQSASGVNLGQKIGERFGPGVGEANSVLLESAKVLKTVAAAAR